MTALLIWCAVGFIGYWAHRFTWQMQFGCKPITVGTVVASILFSIFAPLLWIFAVTNLIRWLTQGKGQHYISPVLRPFRIVLFNPCKDKETT